MTRNEVLTLLRAATARIRALGAQHVFLFGSVARDEAHLGSDVDIFIDRDPAIPFGLMSLAKVEAELERTLGVEVDVTTRSSLHPLIRKSVEQQAIQVF